MISTYIAIMIGSAIGGAARYATALYAAENLGEAFPWGTLIANVAGSFIVGLVAAVAAGDTRWGASPLLRDFLIIGFCGGYTTFSAFSLQTIMLIRDGEILSAAVNIGTSLILCIVAVWLGIIAGEAISR